MAITPPCRKPKRQFRRLAFLIRTIIAIDGGSCKLHAAPLPREAMLVNVKTGKCLTIAGGLSRGGDKGAAQRSSLAAARG
jgi:hypothetical protein